MFWYKLPIKKKNNGENKLLSRNVIAKVRTGKKTFFSETEKKYSQDFGINQRETVIASLISKSFPNVC